MRFALALAAISFVPCVAAAPGGAGTSQGFPVSAFLCDSAEHAIQFANAIAQGQSEEIARDHLGRAARAEVCGHYAGIAAVESERVELEGGTAYKLTAYRFREDHRIAWLAERSFTPTSTNWDL